MIKNLLDADENDDASVSGGKSDLARNSSILDLGPDLVTAKSVEVLDPFAITDHHIQNTPVSPSASSLQGEPTLTRDSAPSATDVQTPDDLFLPTVAETVRMSGLAWTAGIMFFGSVGFMLVLGWLVDTLLGSSPWGIVGGIILGSIIGFVQLVRINTQILNTRNSARPRSLLDQAGLSENAEADRPNITNPTELVPSPAAGDDPSDNSSEKDADEFLKPL
ncbi:AtpZ/AtpI family protein [Leptolyngbya sp. 7M]|uniref:AtpZ/AtpI family protein n=1 Tax=Leptolyngbya sp. 7M TaxID=2812896 RepID=UPI001B8D6B11|nr:AtpZ/AtpI family protein [Leptolyngbya sp. 7M]QYO67795.1 AtpZ/AtpI family protein [Leptolyngbya sp. 7M]